MLSSNSEWAITQTDDATHRHSVTCWLHCHHLLFLLSLDIHSCESADILLGNNEYGYKRHLNAFVFLRPIFIPPDWLLLLRLHSFAYGTTQMWLLSLLPWCCDVDLYKCDRCVACWVNSWCYCRTKLLCWQRTDDSSRHQKMAVEFTVWVRQLVNGRWYRLLYSNVSFYYASATDSR